MGARPWNKPLLSARQESLIQIASHRRQPMFSSEAWYRHGCRLAGSKDIVDFPLQKGGTGKQGPGREDYQEIGHSLSCHVGCRDLNVRLDHFDITKESRRIWKRFNQLRKHYPVLVDGFELVSKGNWTEIAAPTTRGIRREYGLWSVFRRYHLSADRASDDAVWILYSNQASGARAFHRLVCAPG
jgi:alpha-1,3-glucan synthase